MEDGDDNTAPKTPPEPTIMATETAEMAPIDDLTAAAERLNIRVDEPEALPDEPEAPAIELRALAPAAKIVQPMPPTIVVGTNHQQYYQNGGAHHVTTVNTHYDMQQQQGYYHPNDAPFNPPYPPPGPLQPAPAAFNTDTGYAGYNYVPQHGIDTTPFVRQFDNIDTRRADIQDWHNSVLVQAHVNNMFAPHPAYVPGPPYIPGPAYVPGPPHVPGPAYFPDPGAAFNFDPNYPPVLGFHFPPNYAAAAYARPYVPAPAPVLPRRIDRRRRWRRNRRRRNRGQQQQEAQEAEEDEGDEEDTNGEGQNVEENEQYAEDNEQDAEEERQEAKENADVEG